MVVKVLPESANEYRSDSPAAGKYEICLETRVGGEPNAIGVC